MAKTSAVKKEKRLTVSIFRNGTEKTDKESYTKKWTEIINRSEINKKSRILPKNSDK